MPALRRLVILAATAVLGSTLLTLPASAGTIRPSGTAGPTGTTEVLTFRHGATGRCLDGSVSQGVTIQPCNGGNYQKWDNSLGNTLRSRQDLSKCLDASTSQGVSLKPCNGGAYQNWTASADQRDLIHVQSAWCLDASVSQGAKIKPCVGSSYQVWTR
jgi:hypothetical protein